MIKRIVLLLGLIGVFICNISFAQNLSAIKITGTYSDHLDVTLLDIGTRYHVQFSYSWADIHEFSYVGSFTNAPLDSVLNVFSNNFDLEYYTQDGYVNIERVTKKQKSKNEDMGKYEVKIKSYNGPAKNTNITVTGKIKDAATGESLPFAYIGVKGTQNVAVTNADGYFTLLNVPTDTTTLEADFIGYKNKEVFLTPETPMKNLVVEMYSSSTVLDAVEVKGEREELMRVPEALGVVQIAPKQLELLPSMGEVDIMRSLQLMPGITASKESSAGLYVWGGTPDQNLILYDGFTVYHVDHLYGFFSAFNSNAIKDVQLYKGGFESRFGGRLSSVTEITGKEGNQKKFNAGGEISLLSFNAYIETPIGKKITFLIAGRKSWKGPLYNEIFDEFNKGSTGGHSGGGGGYGSYGNRNATSTTVVSYFYDLNAKMTYRPTDKDIISLSLYNGTDDLNNSRNLNNSSFLQAQGLSLSSEFTDLTTDGNLGGSLKWSRKWSDILYGNTLISYSNYYYTRNLSNTMTTTNNSTGAETTFQSGTIENNNLKDYSFKSDYELDASKNNKIEFGCLATYNGISYNYSQNDTTTILNHHNYGGTTAIYLQDRMLFFNSKFTVLPGIRETYYSPTNKTYTEPRLSLNYDLTDNIKLKGAIGEYYQFVNQVNFEDILAGNSELWLLANGTTVPVSSATHYVLGSSYETNDYLFGVEAYYKNLNNLTQYSLRINPSPGNTVSYDENFYNGTNFSDGIDFLIQKKSGKLTGWVSYTLGQSMDNFAAFSSTPYPSDQDIRNEFHIVLMYQIKRWEFSITWIYATGTPYTAPEGGYQLVMLGGNTKDFINVGAENSLRLPDYHRLDIACNYRLRTPDGRDKGYLGFSIFNVYDRQNVWYKQYQIIDNTIIETNVNYLGITPNLTIALKIR
jgi:hypothetical protein